MTAVLLILTTLMTAVAFVMTLKGIVEDDIDGLIGVFILVASLTATVASFTCVIVFDWTDVDTYRPLLEVIDHDKTKIISENGEPKEYYITVNGEEYHFEIKEEENNVKFRTSNRKLNV